MSADSDKRRSLLRGRIIGALSGSEGFRGAPAERWDEEPFEPFSLLPLQQAYWVGRSGFEQFGANACHGYLELDVNHLDVGRLQQACDVLVARHPMLRAVIQPDGMQRVLQDVEAFPLKVMPLGVDPDKIREELSHQVIETDSWPLFEVWVSPLGNDQSRLHISFDILIADAQSFRILATELMVLYRDPGVELPAVGTTFRQYVTALEHQEGGGARAAAWDYWRPRLDQLPEAPDLPLAKPISEMSEPRIARWEGRLTAEQWAGLQNFSAAARVTPSTALLAAFSNVLGMYASRPEFTLNLTTFDRDQFHPDIDRVVGPFTSTMLITSDQKSNEPVSEFAGRLQRRTWEALEHRAVGGVDLLRELARTRDRTVTLPYVFTFVDTDVEDFRGELEQLGEVRFAISQTPQVLIDCQIARSGDGLLFWWDAAQDAFPRGLLDEAFEAFSQGAANLCEAESWSAPCLITPKGVERAREAVERSVPVTEATLHGLVFDAAEASPDAPAVVGTGVTSYGELAQWSTELSERIRAAGLGHGDVIGIAMDRGPATIVAMLAAMAARAAYLPIDMTWPEERVVQVLRTAGASAVLVEAPLGIDGIPDIVVAPRGADGGLGERTPGEATAADDLAYVIYTSGSTGIPKGVQVRHRAAVNTLADVNRRWNVRSTDRVLAVSSLAFDLSVWDVFGVLGAGGALVLTGRGEAAKDPSEWLRLLLQERVTVWNSAPALMGLLVDLAEIRGVTLVDLRLALLSGDWIPVDLPDRLRAVAPNCEVVSLGGATEAAVWSVAYPIDDVDPTWRSIPYGFPLGNQQLYVLDGNGRERPFGTPGHLAIGGIGLADGYRHAPELTEAAFFDHSEFGRLYRTGDIALRRPDGCLEFLGREDSQVKIQGHRVELGEIDTVLASLDQVRRAVTVATGEPGQQRQLVSRVEVVGDGVTADEIRAALLTRLPDYMVPVRFDLVSDLVLTENGKVDRSATRIPEEHPVDSSGASAPEAHSGREEAVSEADPSPIEAHVLSWVQEKLETTGISPHDNLLHVGLDSVDMLRLAAVMEETLGFHPSHVEVARDPTVATVRRLFEEYVLARLLAGDRLTSPTAPSKESTDEDAPNSVGFL